MTPHPWHVAIDARLRNYGLWARDHRAQNSCGSAEKMWRPYYPESKDPVMPIDARDAQKILDVLRAIPDKPRLLIQLWYVNRAPDYKIAKIVKVPRYRLEEEWHMAHGVVMSVAR